ncbi:MAG: NF038215 family lipoprotein [Acinetobacter sp.]|uniref:NF038215 family lipoprotein n=1 Tax=Acinetobacter sp. TaxID=472 RepID=UPI0026DF9105|nr:NF038215 family lipoprotein [Acinetobacter sp.]MDO5542405.1 NF038215 family lipoprotein [Acinetobacter sp.]
MSFFSHQWGSVFLLGVAVGLCGCDAASVQKTQTQNSRKIETRGMIMVGMPVHEHDYQLVTTSDRKMSNK